MKEVRMTPEPVPDEYVHDADDLDYPSRTVIP